MSLSQPPGGGFGGPPSGYRYACPADGDRPRQQPHYPALPSVSSLLNQEPLAIEQQQQQQQPPPQKNQYMAQQFIPPYNMARPPLPRYQSQQHDRNAPDAPVPRIHPPPPPSPNSLSSPAPPEPLRRDTQRPMATFQPGAPPPASRQARPITQRRADRSKDRDGEVPSDFAPRSHDHYPPRPSRSPSEPSSEPEPRSSRRASTFSEPSSSSSRGMPRMQTSKMPISSFLSEEPSSAVDRPGPRYSLRMRQQPVAARACGFGERDRRVIDPPPILQMHVSAPHLAAHELRPLLQSPYLVIHCSLWDPDNDCDATAMPGTADKRQPRRLMGTLVSSSFVGKDEHGVEGCFFTFPDLSVRTPGRYRLKFALVSLDPRRMYPGTCEPVRSTVISNAFKVFYAKDFAGMRASTALTKTLKHQGCLISVKKGNCRRNNPDEDGDENENDDKEEEEAAVDDSTRRGKRAKR